MKFLSKNKILIFLVVILFVSNLTTIVALIIHKREFHSISQDSISNKQTVMNNGRLFRENLNLSIEQNDVFRELRREYNRSARALSFKMQDKRIAMVNELSKSNPDTIVLNSIANEIGEMHSHLKKLTINYFLDMKRECNTEQKDKLAEIFINLLNNDGNVTLPGPGRGNRKNKFKE